MDHETLRTAAVEVLTDVLQVAFERRLPEYNGENDTMYALEAATVDLAEALVELLPGEG